MKARNLKYHARPADCLPESDGWRYRHDYQLLFGNMSHVLLPPPPPPHPPQVGAETRHKGAAVIEPI